MTGDGDDSSTGDGASDADRPTLVEHREMPDVYGAAEDSALLASTVSERIVSGERALDVGTGSGYVATAMAEGGASVVGVDVNPHACRQARDAGVPVVRGDMLSAFRADAFDVVACNPPYLPTAPDQEWDDWMEAALSGGEDGRRMIEPLLDDVGRVLVADGRLYLLVSSLTDVDAVLEYGQDRGLVGEEVAAEKHAFERLVVLALTPA